jgi:hypothetical protein
MQKPRQVQSRRKMIFNIRLFVVARETVLSGVYTIDIYYHHVRSVSERGAYKQIIFTSRMHMKSQ